MKKLLLMCVYLYLGVGLSYTQVVKPSEQAQGFTGFQNTSVNYSTGTFSYKIPLFELSSGDYKLPVMLSYTANGVKVTDRPGLYGYGWNLICGGVVTRTLRGGLADEKRPSGYAYEGLMSVNDSIRKLVNQHYKDGESDIFTAVFNGKVVYFILEPAGNNKVRAVPLEKTNVKIEDNAMGEIFQWKITDEDGVIYIFKEIERTENVGLEEGVSRNSVTGESYVSSWYLTEIVLPNSKNIEFKYTNKYSDPYSNPNDTYSTMYYSNMAMGYEYGRPLVENTFDVKPWEKEIQNSFDDINFYAARTSLEAQVRDTRYMMDELALNRFNSLGCGLLPSNVGESIFIDKMMGLITNLEQLGGNVGSQAVDAVNECMASIHSLAGTSINYQMLYSALGSLKQIYINILTTRDERFYNPAGQVRKYKINTKCLTSVLCGDREVKLTYTNYPNKRMLTNIVLFTHVRDTLVNVDLDRRYGDVLGGIKITGANDTVVQTQTFSYYDTDNYSEGADAWGYYNGETRGIDALTISGIRYPFIYVPNISSKMEKEIDNFRLGTCEEAHLKKYSLKTIRTSAGARINIDYEKNWIFWRINSSWWENADYSGLRVKSLAIYDGNNKVDSVYYHYTREGGESTGKLVVTGLNNGYTLQYNSVRDEGIYSSPFNDKVLCGLIQDDGMAILGSGNNGVMYDYVREERVGRGSTGYYFLIPQNAVSGKGIPTEYSYWMYGLPLGQVDYDNKGHVVRMIKNKYYASSSPSLSNVNSDFVQMNSVPFPFSSVKLQLKPYGFYIDKERIKREYQGKPQICICRDGLTAYYIDPYEHVYKSNIAPRTNIIIPDQSYNLYYGGKVVLKEREMYTFASTSQMIAVDTPRYNDFYGSLPAIPYQLNKETYYYGTNHTLPVKIVREKSNGDQLVEYTRRVTDVNPVSGNFPEITKMKSCNILSPIVQQQVFLTSQNTSYKIGESVIEYSLDTLQGKNSYFRSKEYSLKIESPESVSLPGTSSITSPFSEDKSKYISTEFFYSKVRNNFVLVETRSQGQNESFVYDPGNEHIILSGRNISASNIDARDVCRSFGLTSSQQSALASGNVTAMYPPEYASDSAFLMDYYNTTNSLLKLESVKNNPFFRGELFEAAYRYMLGIYMKSPYAKIKEFRDLLMANMNFPTKFADALDQCENVNPVLKDRFVSMLLFVLYNVARFDEDAYRFLGLESDRMMAGLDLSRTLSVNVDKYRVFNLAVVMRRISINDESVSCKVIYKDGSSREFHEKLNIEKDNWRVGVLKIDLSEQPTPENIVRLEVLAPLYGGEIEGIIYGGALAVLAPDGVEYEALSRDQQGRIFCKLNHLMQLERYEYDGLGRVTKVFDQDGNLLRRTEYNEAIATNN